MKTLPEIIAEEQKKPGSVYSLIVRVAEWWATEVQRCENDLIPEVRKMVES